MKFRHRFEAPALEEMKEKVITSRLTPVVIMAVTCITTVLLVNKKETKVTINVNNYDRD